MYVGTGKRIDALAKKKDFAVLQKWKNSIVNHMFWCAASSNDDDCDLKEAKWVSITNHIMDKHSGHENPLFSKCLHGRLHGSERKKSGSNQVNYVELGRSVKGLSCDTFLHTYSRVHMYISFTGT